LRAATEKVVIPNNSRKGNASEKKLRCRLQRDLSTGKKGRKTMSATESPNIPRHKIAHKRYVKKWGNADCRQASMNAPENARMVVLAFMIYAKK
jgi:hypothetical protein